MTIIVRNLTKLRLIYFEYARFPLVPQILSQSRRKFYVQLTAFSAVSFPESHDKHIIVENRTPSTTMQKALYHWQKTQCRLQTRLNLDLVFFFLRRTTRAKEQLNFLCRYFSCFRQAGKLEKHRVINFFHFHARGDKHKISNLVIILLRLTRYLKTALFSMMFRSVTIAMTNVTLHTVKFIVDLFFSFPKIH